jgi:hypothetical protein
VSARLALLAVKVSAENPKPPKPPRQPLRLPSISQLMVRGAVRRLPAAMSDAEKVRWGREMREDVASISSRRGRLRCAYGAWRKGAPGMPVGGAGAPRSAD